MSSSRLPGKSLLPLNEETVIKRVYDNANKSGVFEKVLVLTSTDKTDDELCHYLDDKKIEYLRGSLNNVFSRYIQILTLFETDSVVRLTGDNPLIDSRVIRDVVTYHTDNAYDYTSNIINRKLPRGNDVECIKRQTLESLKSITLTQEDLEHVTLFIRKNPKLYNLGSFEKDYNLKNKDIRLTLDYEEDYKFLLEIYNKLNLNKDFNDMYKIDKFITENPNFKNLNNNVSQTEVNNKIW